MAEGTPLYIIRDFSQFISFNQGSETKFPEEIKFESPYPEGVAEDEDEKDPYISLAHPGNLKKVENGDEFVTPPVIIVEYDYPLSKEFYFVHCSLSPKGFTRAELALSISNTYKKIYRDEEDAAGNPGNVPGMMNRAESNGPYGIWGHDLGDLLLHTVILENGKKFNLPLYTLGIDS